MTKEEMLDEINRITMQQIAGPMGIALNRFLDAKDKQFRALQEARTGPQPQHNPPTSSHDDTDHDMYHDGIKMPIKDRI